MATSLGEGKLWIQACYRPSEGWILPDYSWPWVKPPQPKDYGASE